MDEEALRQLLTRDPGEITGAVTGKQEPGSVVEVLWALSRSRRESKQVRKSAKKALYILRSKGINVDRFQPSATETEGEGRAGGSAELVSPFVSIPDSSLNSQLLLPVEGADGSFTVYDAITSMDRGILRFNAGRGSRRQVERFARENPAFLEIDPEYALFRFSLSRDESAGTVAGLSSIPPVLAVDPGPVVHPVLRDGQGRFPRIVSADQEQSLFTRPEVARLALPGHATAEYREQIESARANRLIIGNRSPQERVQGITERFYRAWFTPLRLEHLKYLLLDLALYFLRGGEREAAAVLVRYAEGLRAAGVSPRSGALPQHPFLQFLVYRSLSGH